MKKIYEEKKIIVSNTILDGASRPILYNTHIYGNTVRTASFYLSKDNEAQRSCQISKDYLKQLYKKIEATIDKTNKQFEYELKIENEEKLRKEKEDLKRSEFLKDFIKDIKD